MPTLNLQQNHVKKQFPPGFDQDQQSQDFENYHSQDSDQDDFFGQEGFFAGDQNTPP